VLKYGEVKLPAVLRRRLTQTATAEAVGKQALAQLDAEFGRWIGKSVSRLLAGSLRKAQVDAIASHGQTVGHWPGGRPRATLQIGDPDQIAKLCGLPVISHFRQADTAVGGEGAPLTPAVNRLLFARRGMNMGVLNIGGMANLTVIPPRGSSSQVIGTDCGPGNMLIDLAARRWLGRPFDRNGRAAARGHLHPALFGTLTRHRWFKNALPASCGREEFGEAFLDAVRRHHRGVSVPDFMATLTAFSGWCVGRALWLLPLRPHVLYISGGGVHNQTLVKAIARTAGATPVRPISDLGVDPDALEAVSFALLGYLNLRRIPVDLAGATKARRPAVLGRLTWP
jgi:anhydro-N-acetylmuramic acid kinase